MHFKMTNIKLQNAIKSLCFIARLLWMYCGPIALSSTGFGWPKTLHLLASFAHACLLSKSSCYFSNISEQMHSFKLFFAWIECFICTFIIRITFANKRKEVFRFIHAPCIPHALRWTTLRTERKMLKTQPKKMEMWLWKCSENRIVENQLNELNRRKLCKLNLMKIDLLYGL